MQSPSKGSNGDETTSGRVAVTSAQLAETKTTTEAEDVRLAAAGDALAFERLYRRHVPRIHALVRRMLGGRDAEDVTQEVFIRAWERLETFRGDASFGTWLHRLAINLTLSERGSRGRREERFPLGEPPPGTSIRARRPDMKMDFERALERLPDGAREVLVLYDVEGYKHHEIAEMLGVTVGTSKSQLHRARTEMRRHLEA